MKLNIPAFGKKKEPKYWEAKLDIAQAELWNQNYEKAKALYLEISQDLVRAKSNRGDSAFDSLKAEASIGLWSVEYLNDKSSNIGWQEYVTSLPENTRILVFIGKVLGSRWDSSLEAIKLYQQLLNTIPSEKNARYTWRLLQKADYSDQAFALIKQIAGIIDDVDLLSSMLKWSMNGRNYPLASSLAVQIIQKESDNGEAHRSLGVIAESKKEWEKAATHYQSAGEWIRLAVAWNHCGQYDKALSALRKVPENGQNDPTWLYHIGWCMFKIGDIYRSLGFWKQLKNNFPEFSAKVDQAIEEIQAAALHNLLENDNELELKEIPSGPEPYFSEAVLRKALIELLVNRDAKAAAEIIGRAGERFIENEKIVCLDYVIRAALSEDPQLDQVHIGQLMNRFRQADLYLLLRCLWLAPIDPARAAALIDRMGSDQTETYRESTAASNWLIRQLCFAKEGAEQDLNRSSRCSHNQISLDPNNPFSQAILNSYVASLLRDSQIGELERTENLLSTLSTNSPVTLRIQALYLAKGEKWLQAIKLLNNALFPEIEDKLIEAGIRDYLKKYDWSNLASLAIIALNRKPENIQYQNLALALHPFIIHNSWKCQNTDGLDSYFSKIVEEQPGNMHRHHELALVYTRRAVIQDTNSQGGSPLDFWELAIGHWAVILTSAKYWNLWAEERCSAYGNGMITKEVVDQLRKDDIPSLLKRYIQEKEEDLPPLEATRYHFYHALVDQEIYNTKAVRQLIKLADESHYDLPEEIYTWISPALIRQHNLYHINSYIYEAINKLSPPESAGLAIKRSISGLYKVQAYASNKQYELALDELKKLEQAWNTSSGIEWIRYERIEILTSFTSQLIQDQNWEQALKVARDAFNQFPANHSLDKNYQAALTGWANLMLQSGESAKVVDEVDELLETHESIPGELALIYMEALLQEGRQAFEVSDWEWAINRFEAVLEWEPNHQQAKGGLAAVYMQMSFVAEEQKNYFLAYQNAQKMYQQVQDETTATIYASACAKYALYLSEKKRFSEAITILEPALRLPYDRQEFQLEKLLSAILTDYGAILYNSGSTYQGTQMMRRALTLDPTNQVARQNLRISGDIYW